MNELGLCFRALGTVAHWTRQFKAASKLVPPVSSHDTPYVTTRKFPTCPIRRNNSSFWVWHYQEETRHIYIHFYRKYYSERVGFIPVSRIIRLLAYMSFKSHFVRDIINYNSGPWRQVTPPPLSFLGFTKLVLVTLGLPYIRAHYNC